MTIWKETSPINPALKWVLFRDNCYRYFHTRDEARTAAGHKPACKSAEAKRAERDIQNRKDAYGMA